MEIVRNIPDLQTAIGTGNTVCSYWLPNDAYHAGHAGHAACISGCKQQADLALVYCWPNIDCVTYLFNPTYSGIEPEWDESYYTDFCQTHGADIVFIPDLSYLEDNFFEGEDIEGLKSLASAYSVDNGYDALLDGLIYLFVQWILIAEKIRNDNSYWRNDFTICYWPEEPFRFVYKHLMENYFSIPVTVIGPIRRPDGLHYDARLSPFGEEDVARLAQVKSKIEEVGFDLYNSDPDQYKTAVASGVDSIDTRQEKEFRTGSIELSTGGHIGASNLLVAVNIRVLDAEENNGYHLVEYYEDVVN